MKIAYASRTGTVQSIVERLGVEDAINVVDEPPINEDYIIHIQMDMVKYQQMLKNSLQQMQDI